MQPLVSVIVPAYNAEPTLARTLQSAAGQTYPSLEIVVSDDGSTDRTADIVRQFAERDPRIKLVSSGHQGVAIARNTAIAAAQGDFIAPLDADDLWHPDKISRQMAAMQAAPADTALVYNWSRYIDEDDMVIGSSFAPRLDGHVLHRHLAWNFIANGSTPLVKREAFDREPYEPALQRAGNVGCEDYLMQLKVAMRYRYACVPAFLTGYRKTASAMSMDSARMLRSRFQALDIIEPQLPKSALEILQRERARFSGRVARVLAKSGDWKRAREAAGRAMDANAGAALMTMFAPPMATLSAPFRAIRNRAAPVEPRHFSSYDPEERFGRAPASKLSRREARWLRSLDEPQMA